MKKRIALTLVITLLLSVFTMASVSDKDYGQLLKDYGIVEGDQTGNLNPTHVLNREESIALLARLMGVDEKARQKKADHNFKDVPNNHWAEGYITYAKSQGWTKGIGKGKFGLGDDVTLQQFTTFMLRALDYGGDNLYRESLKIANDKHLLDDVTVKEKTAVIKRSDAFTMMYHTLQATPRGQAQALIYILGIKETANTALPATPYPLSIENYDGKTLAIKQKPQRIASLILGTDELLLELVDKSRIVGLSGQVGNASSVSLVAKKANDFPKLKNNFEVILKQQPDLIIGSSWIKDELLAQIKDSGIDYYGYKSPNTIDEQIKVIRNFAVLLGEQQKGEVIIANWQKRLAVIKEQAKSIKSDQVVTVLPYNMHGKTNAKGTIVDEIIYLIGAKNAATEAGLEKRAKLSKEKLIEINPDVILVMAWGMDDLDTFNQFVADMKNDPSLKDLKAVKNDRIIVEEGRYMTIVTQHLIEGIEFVAKSVYPEVYGK